MLRLSYLSFLCCASWLLSALPAWSQAIDVDSDPAVQEKLTGFKKRVFDTVMLEDLQTKFPDTGDLRVRRAAIHKIMKWFPDKTMQVKCAFLEMALDVTEADLGSPDVHERNLTSLKDHLAALRQAHAADFTKEQTLLAEFYDGAIALASGDEETCLKIYSRIATQKEAPDWTRLQCYRCWAEVLIGRAQPGEAAKVLAAGSKSLDAGVAPLLDAVKSGVLDMIGQKAQAQELWRSVAKNYGPGSGPIYNLGLTMAKQAIWAPIADEMLTQMVESAHKLAFFSEVEKAVEEVRKLVKARGQRGLQVIAYSQEKQGRYEQAAATYGRTPKEDKEYFDAGLAQAILLAELGKTEESQRVLTRISQSPSASSDSPSGKRLAAEMATVHREGSPILATYAHEAARWWARWEKLAPKLGLNADRTSVIGTASMEPVWKAKQTSAKQTAPWNLYLRPLAHWARTIPLYAGSFAYHLADALDPHPEAAPEIYELLVALAQSLPNQVPLSKAHVIDSALRAHHTAQLDLSLPSVGALCQDFYALDLPITKPLNFVASSVGCAYLSLYWQENLTPAGRRLERLLDTPNSGLETASPKDLRQVLSALYLAEGKALLSESILQQDQAWPLPEKLRACAQQASQLYTKKVISLETADFRSAFVISPQREPCCLMLAERAPGATSQAAELPQAGPYGPSLKAALAQVQPNWYEFVEPKSVRDNLIRDEAKFLTADDPSLGLWNRFKGGLLYAADVEKSLDTRRTGVVIAAACAYQTVKSLARLQAYFPLSLTTSMNDPANYTVEMRWAGLAVSQGAPTVAQTFLDTLQAAAALPVHDQRLDSFLKQNGYFMELYSLEPSSEAALTAFRQKVLTPPMDNDRAQVIAPTYTFLLNHGLTKAASAWRADAMASVGKNEADLKSITGVLDQAKTLSDTWRPVHQALCAVLWKHVDQSAVTKPREVDGILNQVSIGLEYSPETLRKIYFYYLKRGGLFWQSTHWHHLLQDALPDDEQWGALKRELCATALTSAPNDAIRAEFAGTYNHYFSLAEPANRDLLKRWVEPYIDLKAHPIMGQVARWVDINSAFAAIDNDSYSKIINMPPDTSDPLERLWRTVGVLLGRGQSSDLKALLKTQPESVYEAFAFQGTILRALEMTEDTGRLARIKKLARNNVQSLIGRVWVGRDLDLLAILFDLVDALDERILLPEPFLKEMRAQPYLPLANLATAWSAKLDQNWKVCQAASENGLQQFAGDVNHRPILHYFLGLAAYHRGDKATATTALTEFIRLDPSSVHWKTAAELLDKSKE